MKRQLEEVRARRAEECRRRQARAENPPDTSSFHPTPESSDLITLASLDVPSPGKENSQPPPPSLDAPGPSTESRHPLDPPYPPDHPSDTEDLESTGSRQEFLGIQAIKNQMRAIEIQIRTRDAGEMVELMRNRGISTNGGIEEWYDRYWRYNVRKDLGLEYAPWDPSRDGTLLTEQDKEVLRGVAGPPSPIIPVERNPSSSLVRPCPSQALPEQRNETLTQHTTLPSKTYDTQHTHADTHISNTPHRNIHEYANQTQRHSKESWQGRLPTGQSQGRYQDPITFGEETGHLITRADSIIDDTEDERQRRTAVTFANVPTTVHMVPASTPTPEGWRRQEPPPKPYYDSTHTQTHTRQSHTVPVDYTDSQQTFSSQRYPCLPPAPPDTRQYATSTPYPANTNVHNHYPPAPPTHPVPYSQHSYPGYPYHQPADPDRRPPVQCYQNPATLYPDSTRILNPNITHTIPYPTNDGIPRRDQRVGRENSRGEALQWEPSFGLAERPNLTSGYIPFEKAQMNSLGMHSTRVSKCGAYLREGKIRFETADDNPEEFLRNVKAAAEMYQLDANEALGILPYVLGGHALEWYRAECAGWESYADFVAEFRLSYSSFNIQERLWDEIKSRTQGAQEPLATYLTSLRILFSRINQPVPEFTQLDIAFKNMNPKYLGAIRRTEVNSINELRALGHEYENRLRYMASYTPPKPPEKSLVPSAAYQHKPKRHERVAAVNQPVGTREAPPVTRNIPKPQNTKHRTQEISTQTELPVNEIPYPRPFETCFQCGQPGHYRRVCPNRRVEHGQGNGRRG